MRNPIISLILFFLLISTNICSSAKGQIEFGFKVSPRMKSIQIPFEQHNNLIVIPVTLNNYLTLKFILDTGVKTAILTEKIYGDIVGLNYTRELNIIGPGIIDSVAAVVANQTTFTLPGGIEGENMNMLVLKEDYLDLSKSIGDEVCGIIGYDLFSRFIVEIDYDNEVITLYNPKKFKPARKATKVPIEIIKSKPFINANLVQKGKEEIVDFMIDTGASHAVLIDYNNVATLDVPEKRVETQLGRGIAGEILGFLSRMDSLSISHFGFNEVLISAPFQGAYNKSIKRGARVGTFGGEILNRFIVTIDYFNKFIYLKKGRTFQGEFEHNMSGLLINATGINLDTLKVMAVDPNSPANNAGLMEEDIILSINGMNLKTATLSNIYGLLRSKEGKKIRLKIFRQNDVLRKKFYLKRKI